MPQQSHVFIAEITLLIFILNLYEDSNEIVAVSFCEYSRISCENMTMSSKHALANAASGSNPSMMWWKIAIIFINRDGLTGNWYVHDSVMNAVSFFQQSCILICQYPEKRSDVLKTSLLVGLRIMASIFCSGRRSLLATWKRTKRATKTGFYHHFSMLFPRRLTKQMRQ